MMLKSIIRKSVIMVALTSVFFMSAIGQTDTTRNNALRVFLDCQMCDMNYIREEIPYVNYVREVKESQVYVLVTRQQAGSGGSQYTLFYSGQENFTGMKDTLSLSTNPDQTQAIIRENLTKTLAAGFIRYVAKTPLLNQVQINYQSPAGGARQAAPQQVEDKWNNWVFEIQTSPSFNIQEFRKNYSWSNGIEANHITSEWKLENRFSHSFNRTVNITPQRIIFRDGLPFDTVPESRRIDERKTWSVSQLTVKSLNDHWSVGFLGQANHSTVDNYDLNMRLAPAVEYNIFPYSQSNQKQLRMRYSLGYVYHDYIDTTSLDFMEEGLFEERLDVAFQVQQSWGSANVSLGFENYMQDFKQNAVDLNGFVNIRVIKGLSARINGSIAFVHNERNTLKRELSIEERLAGVVRVPSTYQYSASVSLTYTFGSIYNNVVNPRFGGGQMSGGQGGGSGFQGGR